MANSKDIINQAERAIKASQTTSATPPGPAESAPPTTNPEQIEAINQVFALFRLNYHNQYYAAYPDADQVKQIKKLWLESLGSYSVEQILRGARHAIEHSEYLPTLHRMHECCAQGMTELGLPSPRDAYIEACQRPSPKSAQAWSHPAVYLAGRDTGWFVLANQTEQTAFPQFQSHYQHYSAAALRGENMDIPQPEAITQAEPEPLSQQEQLAALAQLRKESGLNG